MNKKRQLNILYTDIGRGHPHYLDGVIECMRTKYPDQIHLNTIDVFALSHGLSLKLWCFVRWLYRVGSQGGIIGRLYGAIRKGRNPGRYGLLEKYLARDIRKYLKKEKYPTLVAHPILIRMISDIVEVYYQHGEIAVPDEAVVKGPRSTFVPLVISKEKFLRAGSPEINIGVTGLCIENQLAKKASDYFECRLSRINGGGRLCGGFFSSGAEPIQHIDKIILALDSLKRNGGQACVFCKKDGILEKAISDRLKIRTIDNFNQAGNIGSLLKSANILAFSYENRQEENICTIHLFEFLDYFVAPSHERTGWAVGLGLPMFILHPVIGTFSPLNREFLLKQGVAVDLDTNHEAKNFGEMLSGLVNDDSFLKMVQNGYGKFDINGFDTVADFLKDELI